MTLERRDREDISQKSNPNMISHTSRDNLCLYNFLSEDCLALESEFLGLSTFKY
jgi:hypothetical protein